MEHFLHDVEPDASFGLVLGDGVKVKHIIVAKIASKGVPVLICQPFVFRSVSMACSNVFACGKDTYC